MRKTDVFVLMEGYQVWSVFRRKSDAIKEAQSLMADQLLDARDWEAYYRIIESELE